MTKHQEFLPAPTAADDLHALLRVVADPAAHKARLDELVAQQKATEDKIAEHHELVAETRGLHSKAEATNIILENRKQALDAREAELDEKGQALSTAETMRSAAALDRRERAVAAREDSAKRENDRLSALRTDLEARHEKLTRFADALNSAC